jgi:tetratricopeptide (TPR) repeat protein
MNSKTLNLLTFLLVVCVSSFGQSANYFFDKGVTSYYHRDYKGAIENYTRAVQLDSGNTKAYVSRGIAKYYLQDYVGGIEDQMKALKINPKYSDAYFNIGDCKYNLQDYPAAIKM